MTGVIRGACPGISVPMPTGDGLLARLIPHEPISIGAFTALCAAARDEGNGIVEVTQRGSLQIRGLSDASAPAFARVVSSLGIGPDNAPPVLTSPLLGLDLPHAVDLQSMVTALRRELSEGAPLACLGPKVSVLIDSGGELHLDALPADIRLRVTADSRFHLALGADARTSSPVGWIEFRQVIPIIKEILTLIANRGAGTRGKDLGSTRELHRLRASLAAGKATPGPLPLSRPAPEPIGMHRLANGEVAQGIALAFGHATAEALKQFAQTASDLGARSVRPAPGRALLAIGMSTSAADQLRAFAEAEGFVVRPDDPRRYVVACAGAPACSSATLSTRQIAPDVARAAGMLLGKSTIVHLSGCRKGCAHPGPAAVTVVGPDSLILGGRAGDASHSTISTAGVAADVRRLLQQLAEQTIRV